MGWYDSDKSTGMSKEEFAEFFTRYKPPYTADKYIKFYLSRIPRFISIVFKFYFIILLVLGLLVLVVMGLIHAPLLIVAIGLCVYIFGRRKKSKLK